MKKFALWEFLRRYAVIAAFAIWMGGLTFYGLVVVPIGADTIGSTQQGFITRQVTEYLNWIGCGALAIFLWDVIRKRSKWLAATWFILLAAQIALMAMHPRLESMLNPTYMEILDGPRFHTLHEIYLTVTAVQWSASLVYLALTIWRWQSNTTSATSKSAAG